MKKFIFGLEALLDVKKMQKDHLHKEYIQAAAQLEQALEEKETLETECRQENEKYEAKVKKGIAAGDLEGYSIFFKALHESIAEACRRITRAGEETEAKRDALACAYREVKSLEKLREKQYGEYLEQEEKKETRLTEDILAYRAAGAAAKRSAT